MNIQGECMIEIVNSKNKIDQLEVRSYSQEFAFNFLVYNVEASNSKISSSKINTFAQKVCEWLCKAQDMDGVRQRMNCLSMSRDMLVVNAKIKDLEENMVDPGTRTKVSVGSLFSHATKLLEYRTEGA
jgi:hypothetical protein